jgi:hypothetical protein
MYDLHTLGWHSFQQLCLTIIREILGQTVEAFLDTSDAGKDGAFAGTWKATNGEALSGRFVIQCKFSSKRDKNLTVTDLGEDIQKTEKLVKAGRCDCYLLMTNAGLSGSAKEDIESAFHEIGVKAVVTYGSTWISQQIKENKRLRMLVPRIYGMGDLSQILDERAYEQARALLATLREDLSKVVLTDAYRKAAEALDKHGFVLLIGEPAAGKTTIASMLSMGALDQWGASTMKLDSSEKVVERWNPHEPSQFFWIDDAFGVTQYESFLVHSWNHALPMVRTMLNKGAKIVMTSRDYIYNRARNELKEGAFPVLRESQVVIDVRDLSLEEKQQILYNHIKLGRQDQAFRTAIKPHLPLVAGHARFVPETARRLADPLFTRDLQLTRYSINDFVERRERFLQEVLRGLDDHSKAALALIYMSGDALESPIVLEESTREAVERLGSGLGGCITALESLKGSLVQCVQSEGRNVWTFKHPTVADAFAALLLENAELLGIYVHGTPIDALLSQVTCGDVGLEKAVALPKSLFPAVLDKLEGDVETTNYKTPYLARWHIKDRIDSFLSFRCSKEFIELYLKRHPDVLGRVSKPGLFLSSVSEVDLAIRLHEVGLLPEEHRKAFVEQVVAYAMDGEDMYGIESMTIQGVFSGEELENFRHRVRTELVPKLADVRRTWQRNRNADEEPDQHMSPLLDSLGSLKEEFADDPEIVKKIERQIELTREWIDEKQSEKPEQERPARAFGEVETTTDISALNRSIFDDVDS